MTAREQILQRIKRYSAGQGARQLLTEPPVTLPAGWSDVLVDRLVEGGASVYRAATPAAARLHLATWLQDREVSQVVAWPLDKVGVPGLAHTLDALGIRWAEGPMPPAEGELPPMDWVAITGVHGVVWPTGTLLFVDEPDTPVYPVLWATTHVVVVTVAQVYPSIAAWWRAVAPRGPVFAATGLARSWAFGIPPVPSHLTPRERHVVLVEETSE